jgi:hypothetical protein
MICFYVLLLLRNSYYVGCDSLFQKVPDILFPACMYAVLDMGQRDRSNIVLLYVGIKRYSVRHGPSVLLWVACIRERINVAVVYVALEANYVYITW